MKDPEQQAMSKIQTKCHCPSQGFSGRLAAQYKSEKMKHPKRNWKSDEWSSGCVKVQIVLHKTIAIIPI